MIATNVRSRWLLASLLTCLLSSLFFSSASVFAAPKVDLATKLKRLHSHVKSLQQEPNLPLLPKHPRRKLKAGLQLAQSHGTGSGYSLTYEVDDKVSNVIDWYKSALSGLGWSVESKSISEYQKNRKYLMATREGKATNCVVAVFPGSYDDNQCQVLIRYSDFPPVPAPSKDKFGRFSRKP